ncbi:SPOR domain-containing protein [Moraxellaceae bacterium AER2_44_116]|jgi:hypothetical protein|nr:SPOR domain-containing protein [Moraxellaceae bacterium]TQC97781.1 SPOR domain-containing protein [Moraxellaceae bacterium AER2_44_116]
MINFQSRWWLPVMGVSLAILIVDMTVVAIKGRNAEKAPSIQDVFQGETHEFSDDLGQLRSVVPPTDYVATEPENHGPQYRTADWLKAQGSLAWTLQVMAVEDEEVAKSYLAKREDKEQFAYFMYKEGEKTEYIVIYGNFVTMELALGVADTTDFSLPEGIRAGPEKFMTYVPHVPLIQPAIDQPPPAKYGAVPIIPAENNNPESEVVSPSTEVSPLGSENSTNSALPEIKPEVDPF